MRASVHRFAMRDPSDVSALAEAIDAGRIHELPDEISRSFHTGRGLAAAFAVPGQVDGPHIPAVMGQVSALQDPDAVVVEHAVDENDMGLARHMGAATGINISG